VTPTPRRTIAIGDVHGCSKALDALIAAIGPAEGDEIVALGDYVDRGPDARGVIDRLIELGRRSRLVPLLGNHDELMLGAIEGEDPAGWYASGGLRTLDSYGPVREIAAIPEGHARFLRDCLPYHETETHIFAHANYDPARPMAEQPASMLRREKLRWHTPRPHASGKTVILGHNAQKAGEILDLGHLICIDTYCHGGGWLTALDVDSGRVWQFDRDGRPR